MPEVSGDEASHENQAKSVEHDEGVVTRMGIHMALHHALIPIGDLYAQAIPRRLLTIGDSFSARTVVRPQPVGRLCRSSNMRAYVSRSISPRA